MGNLFNSYNYFYFSINFLVDFLISIYLSEVFTFLKFGSFPIFIISGGTDIESANNFWTPIYDGVPEEDDFPGIGCVQTGKLSPGLVVDAAPNNNLLSPYVLWYCLSQ